MKTFLCVILLILPAAAVFAQNPASQNLVTNPPVLAPKRVIPEQKFIDEVIDELRKGKFAENTFREIGTTHEGLTFEQLWEIASENNPSIKQKANLLAAARGGQIQSGLYPNPTVSWTGDNLGVNGTAGKQGFAVSQPFVTAGKKQLDRTVASYDTVIAGKQYEMEKARVHNDLQIAHAEMLHDQIYYISETFCHHLGQNLLRAALELEKQGKSRPIDVLKFKTSIKESELALIITRRNIDASRTKVSSLLGVDLQPNQMVQGSLSLDGRDTNWASVWETFRHTSPQISVAQSKVAQSRANLSRQLAERTPDVSGTFSLARDIIGEKTVPLASVSLPLKIYDRNQGNIRKAQAQIAAAHRDAERIEMGLQNQLAAICRDYDNAKELIVLYEQDVLPDSFQTLKMVEDAYAKGGISYLELYEQRQSMMNLLLKYVDALRNQKVAAVLMDGALLQGSLD
ncbi:MAG: TolC family protein [Planctomycetaceae bacterium]|jgi:outer membrane protein TolC|nr:TolC family protein [Planctomycetaceae bacterium]